MTFNDIFSAYNLQFQSQEGVLSDFATCSEYQNEKGETCSFVTSKTQCYNFDKIARKLPCLTSTDSLYFDIKHKKVYFVEFKHQSVYDDEVKSNIKSSGIHSRLLNDYLLENINNHKRSDFKYVYLICIKSCPENIKLISAYKKAKMSGARCEYAFYNELHGKLCDKKYFSMALYDDLIFMDSKGFDKQF